VIWQIPGRYLVRRVWSGLGIMIVVSWRRLRGMWLILRRLLNVSAIAGGGGAKTLLRGRFVALGMRKRVPRGLCGFATLGIAGRRRASDGLYGHTSRVFD
jgi:hypothetical protein